MADNNGTSDAGNAWPPVAVAIAIVVVLGLLGTAAIVRYEADQALQIWAGLTGVLGAVIGVIGTFFFRRETVKSAQNQANAAARSVAAEQERAKLTYRALVQTAGHLEPGEWARLRETDHAVRVAVAAER